MEKTFVFGVATSGHNFTDGEKHHSLRKQPSYHKIIRGKLSTLATLPLSVIILKKRTRLSRILYLFFIFLCICTQIPLKATEQRGEYIIVGNDTLEMLTYPLNSSEGLSKQVKQRLSSRAFSTDCWRGYVGIWRLESDKLYLEKIIDSCGDAPYRYVNVEHVFDKYKDKEGRIEALWFSGNLQIIRGKHIAYGEFGRIFEYETVYQIKNGIVKKMESFHNTIKGASMHHAQAVHCISENFNGDLFPELSDKKLFARINLLPHDDGKIDSLHITLKIDEGDWKTYAPAHPYVKELKRCIALVPDWEVTHLYGEKKWEEIHETIWVGKGCKAVYEKHQLPDLIYYKDTLYSLKEFPLQYDTRLYARLRPYVNGRFDFKCKRGYVATWELFEDRLFLKSIRRLNDRKEFPLEQIFPDMQPGERIEATWYSGNPQLTYGKKLKEFREYYPIEIDCGIEKGKVIHKDVYRNFLITRDKKSYENCEKVLKALDWNSDSELNGRMIEVYYTILPDMDGSVKEIQVVLNTRGPLQGNNSRIEDFEITDLGHPYIKMCRDELTKVRWEVLFERNEIIPVKGSVHIQNMRGNMMDRLLNDKPEPR